MAPALPEQLEAESRQAANRGDRDAAARLLGALMDQAQYPAALALAMELLNGPLGGLDARLAHTQQLVTCCSQLGLAQVAAPYIQQLALDVADSPHASDYAWPGLLKSWLAQIDEAVAWLEGGLARFPGAPYILSELGRCQRMRGERGGLERVKQFAAPDFWSTYYGAADVARMWRGEPLAGRRLRVLRQGGIGDALQFVRYARVLPAHGAGEIQFNSPTPQLDALLASVNCVVPVRDNDPRPYDCWTSTFGLGLNLMEAHGVPNAGPYLQAPPSAWADALLAQARARARGRRCIGLWWHSDAPFGLLRSVPLAALLPLLGLQDVHWVVLQRGVALRQLQASGLDTPCTLVPDAASLGDQARLVAGLDGMVTIDAFALHLAGALGCPSWMLAGRSLDWRYHDAEHLNPLYTNARICRQPALGDWRGAVRLLCEELAAR